MSLKTHYTAKELAGLPGMQKSIKGVINGSYESRPIKNKPWEYLFFLDLLGHRDQPAVKKAIAGLEKNCVFLKILGSYGNAR